MTAQALRPDAQRLYTVELDLVGALATPTGCPGCGCEELVPHRDGSTVAFTCSHCARVWYAEAGTLVTLRRFPVARPDCSDRLPPQRTRP